MPLFGNAEMCVSQLHVVIDKDCSGLYKSELQRTFDELNEFEDMYDNTSENKPSG